MLQLHRERSEWEYEKEGRVIAAPCVSACSSWATVDDICSPCDDYDTLTTVVEDMLPVASDILYELSGRRFPGSCSETVRPCGCVRASDSPPYRDSGYSSAILSYNSTTHSFGCGCSSGSRCSCPGLQQIDLGYFPLTSITEILLDGAVLPTDSYRVDEFRYLVRLDGEPWPRCQDLSLPSTEDDTFEVSFTYGVPPPPAGVHAAAILACELALSCQPESGAECRLPKRVQTITRQGVSMTILDPFDFLTAGRTGIYEIDLFLGAYNPSRLRRRAGVYTPDIGPKSRRVGT